MKDFKITPISTVLLLVIAIGVIYLNFKQELVIIHNNQNAQLKAIDKKYQQEVQMIEEKYKHHILKMKQGMMFRKRVPRGFDGI